MGEITFVIFENFKIFKNALGTFIPNRTSKHVITSTNTAASYGYFLDIRKKLLRKMCITSFSSSHSPTSAFIHIYPHLPTFSCIWSECRKIRTRKSSNTDTFHAVNLLVESRCSHLMPYSFSQRIKNLLKKA